MGSRPQRACWVLFVSTSLLHLPLAMAAASGQAGNQALPPLRCIAEPATVVAGETVRINAEVETEALSARTPEYTWTTTGGQIAVTGSTARVSTVGVPPGSYIVTGTVHIGKRKSQMEQCRAAFRVTENIPPSITCSANPTRIVPGAFTSITAVAKGSGDRPLTYSYGTTAGQITGTGPTATLAAVDVNPGPITVKCNAVDDRGQAASTTLTIEVVPPPPPPVAPPPSVRLLCSVSFTRDRKRPVRVDNEGKGCLDDIALQLTHDPNAKLVIVGNHDAGEKPDASAERTLNVKQYMTAEKGVDNSRIQVRTGSNTARQVENVLVPQGATWDPAGTSGFDPTQVERHGEPYSRKAGN